MTSDIDYGPNGLKNEEMRKGESWRKRDVGKREKKKKRGSEKRMKEKKELPVAFPQSLEMHLTTKSMAKGRLTNGCQKKH